MRITNLILLATLACSCGQNNRQPTEPGNQTAVDSTAAFRQFISRLPPLNVGFTYDLESQDSEGCYHPEATDSLFYPHPFAIVGRISSEEFHAVIHLEPGDDLVPVIRTFDAKGKQVSQEIISFETCAGWDCEYDSCDEKFIVIEKNRIEDVVRLITSTCENENPTTMKLDIRKRIVTIHEKGELVSKEEETTENLTVNDPATEPAAERDSI